MADEKKGITVKLTPTSMPKSENISNGMKE